MVKIAKVRFKEDRGDTVKECSNCDSYIFNKEKYCGKCGALLQWGSVVPEFDDCEHEYRLMKYVTQSGHGIFSIFYCIHCLQIETRSMPNTYAMANR